MTGHRHAARKDELRVRYGRLGVVGRPVYVLALVALLLLMALAAQCSGGRLEEVARCLWRTRPMDPRPEPGQQMDPCGPGAYPYGRGGPCYVAVMGNDGRPILPDPKTGCGQFHGPWSPTGGPQWCWTRFFPRARPAAEAAVWDVPG